MASAWYKDRMFTISAFAQTLRLLQDKEEWALMIDKSSGNDGTRRSTVTTLYQCSKEDVQSQIEAFCTQFGSAAERMTQFDALGPGPKAAMKIAGISKEAWVSSRGEWSKHKSGAIIQSSLYTFARFLENFSGIATIAKAADQQYGGFAFGTLSLLLSVFVHKAQRDQALDDGFAEIGFNLPQLETLSRLQNDEMGEEELRHFNRLQEDVASTFAHIIQFAREATMYYISFKQRLKDTFRSEPIKNKTMEDIRKNLSQIRIRCDMLMFLKIDSLQRTVSQMSVSLSETRNQVIDTSRHVMKTRSSQDTGYLSELRGILGIRASKSIGSSPVKPTRRGSNLSSNSKTDLELYKDMLMETLFEEDMSNTKHVHPKRVTLEQLQDDLDFKKWWQSKRSSLLLAGGSNFEETNDATDLNWISIGAVLVVEEARKSEVKVAYFLGQTDIVNTGRRSSNRTIVANLLYQLAEMHENLLRDKLDVIRRAVNKAAWNSEDGGVFMKHVRPLFLELLEAFPPEEVINIVIDRLDECECAWGRTQSETHTNMMHYLEGLVRIAAESQCCLKVLITVDAARLRQVKEGSVTRNAKEKKVLLLKNEWCQEIDDD